MEEIIYGDTVNGGKYRSVKNRYGKDLAVQLVDCCSPFPIGLELTRQLLTKREMSKFLKYVKWQQHAASSKELIFIFNLNSG